MGDEGSTSSDALARFSREPPHQESSRKVVSGNQGVLINTLPEGAKLQSMQKLTKNDKRSLQQTPINPALSAEEFGDLITADHKVPSGECESRKDHLYAVVVQDLATPRLQSHPCRKGLRKFLERTDKAKVIHTDNPLEFGKACGELSWNHCHFHASPLRNKRRC